MLPVRSLSNATISTAHRGPTCRDPRAIESAGQHEAKRSLWHPRRRGESAPLGHAQPGNARPAVGPSRGRPDPRRSCSASVGAVQACRRWRAAPIVVFCSRVAGGCSAVGRKAPEARAASPTPSASAASSAMARSTLMSVLLVVLGILLPPLAGELQARLSQRRQFFPLEVADCLMDVASLARLALRRPRSPCSLRGRAQDQRRVHHQHPADHLRLAPGHHPRLLVSSHFPAPPSLDVAHASTCPCASAAVAL